jgi:translation initiation factor IF-1
MLGNGRVEAMCFDGTKRLCHIRGKLRKKVRAPALPLRLPFPVTPLLHCCTIEMMKASVRCPWIKAPRGGTWWSSRGINEDLPGRYTAFDSQGPLFRINCKHNIADDFRLRLPVLYVSLTPFFLLSGVLLLSPPSFLGALSPLVPGGLQVWINQGDIVLIGLRDFQDERGDVILKYNADEARNLKTYGELPESARINEGGAEGEGAGGEDIVFDDIDDDIDDL